MPTHKSHNHPSRRDGKRTPQPKDTLHVEGSESFQLVAAERERFLDMLENLPLYVALLSPDYHVPFENRFFRERFGEAKGRRCYEYLFGRTEPCEVCETYKVLRTRAPLEWDWTGPDGRNYHIYDEPFVDADGSTFILEVGVDVTKRRQAEDALRKSQTQLNEAQRIAHMGSWELDLVANILTWSDEIYRIFEIDQKEFGASYEAFLALVHPDDREAVNTAYTDSVKNHTPYTIIHRLLFPDGRTKYVRERCETTYDCSGIPIRSIGTVQDITSQVFVEERLRQSEERYRSLVTATSQIVWATDPPGEVSADIPTWRAFTGQTHEQVKGYGWADALHPDDRDKTTQVWKHAVETRSVYETEYRIRRHDGEYRWFSARGAPVLDNNGSIREWVGTCTDITERITAEEKIKRLSRLYRVLSQTNQVIVRTRNDLALFNEICRVAVEYGKLRMAWVGLVDEPSKTIRPVSSHGITGDYVSTIKISVSDEPEGRGPTGTALREGRIVTCNDFLTDPRMEPWREKAKALRFRSSAVVPFRRDGKLVGALSVYADEPNFFDEDEVSLLSEIGTDISYALDHIDAEEKKQQAEESLRRSEERFRKLFEEDVSGDYIKSPDGVIKTCNPAFARIFGFASVEKAVGKNMRELYADQESRHTLQELIRKNGKAELFEVDMIRKDGGLIHVIENAVGHFDERGELGEIVGYVFDNTERKKAEEALKSSELRYQDLYEHAPDGYLSIEPATAKIMQCNETLAKMTGFTKEEMLAKSLFDLYSIEDHDKIKRGLKQFTEKGEMHIEELKIRKKDGMLIPISLRATAFRDASGNILFSRSVLRDITERKRAEEALELKNSVFDASIAANNIADVHGIITEVNEAFLRIWGYDKKEEVIGKPISHFLADDHEAAAILKTLNETGTWEGDYTARKKDGSTYSAHGLATTLIDKDGNLIGYQSSVIDISDRKRAEEEVNILNEQLEDRVRQRTAQLEAANKELEAFAYSVSHDLRAPLRSIDGFSQALLEDYADKLDDGGKSHLRRVRAASQRMAQLIDDLLTISRVTRVEINLQRVNLSAIAEEVADDLQKHDRQRRVEFHIQPDRHVQADARLMRLVLENLLGNAWKFTSKHPTARIDFGQTEKEGKPIFFVRDDGAGFDMRYADKLFGAFQRLHTADEFPGTGIGLTSVQRILRRHGGKIWAEAEVDRGATFFFTLG